MTRAVVWNSFFQMMVFLELLTASSAAHSVIAERITGAFGGLAVIRCTWDRDNITLDFIEWRKGKTRSGDMLYFDDMEKDENQKRRGIFKSRNITGQLRSGRKSYDLKIHEAIPDDDRYYFCRIQPKAKAPLKGASVKLTLVSPPDSQPVIMDAFGAVQVTSNCTYANDMPEVRADEGQHTFICRVGGSKPYPQVTWQYGNPIAVMQTILSPRYKSRGVFVKSAQRQINITHMQNTILKCTVTVPDETTGEMKNETLCVRLVKSAHGQGLLLIYLSPLVLCSICLVALIHRNGKILKQPNVTKYTLVAKVSLIATSGQIVMGIFVTLHTFTACIIGPSFIDGPSGGRRTRSSVLIIVFVYLSVRVLLNIAGLIAVITKNEQNICGPKLQAKVCVIAAVFWCGPCAAVVGDNRRNSAIEEVGVERETIVLRTMSSGTQTSTLRRAGRTSRDADKFMIVLAPLDITMTVLYLVGIIWNYMAGECHVYDTSFVFLMVLVVVACVIWISINLVSTRQSTKESVELWPSLKKADSIKAITVHILDEALNGELDELVEFASAIASSNVEGSIRIINAQHEKLTADMFKKWKCRVFSMLKQLIGETPIELFEFSRHSADEEFFYLYVKPTSVPLLVPRKFTKVTQAAMPDTKRELIEGMITIQKNYSCFMLSKHGKPVKLSRSNFKQRMNQILQSMEDGDCFSSMH